MEYVKLNGQFPKLGRSAVTLGKFDGIHRGHRKLIRTILERKKEYGELAVVMAFISDRQTILTSEERQTYLEKMGVDVLLECPLNDEIKHMKAENFIRQILKGDLQAECVVVGEDFRFDMNAGEHRSFCRNSVKNMNTRLLSFRKRWRETVRSAVPISVKN